MAPRSRDRIDADHEQNGQMEIDFYNYESASIGPIELSQSSTHSVLMPASQLFAENAPAALEGNQ